MVNLRSVKSASIARRKYVSSRVTIALRFGALCLVSRFRFCSEDNRGRLLLNLPAFSHVFRGGDGPAGFAGKWALYEDKQAVSGFEFPELGVAANVCVADSLVVEEFGSYAVKRLTAAEEYVGALTEASN